jgi:hypothetical protein
MTVGVSQKNCPVYRRDRLGRHRRRAQSGAVGVPKERRHSRQLHLRPVEWSPIAHSFNLGVLHVHFHVRRFYSDLHLNLE